MGSNLWANQVAWLPGLSMSKVTPLSRPSGSWTMSNMTSNPLLCVMVHYPLMVRAMLLTLVGGVRAALARLLPDHGFAAGVAITGYFDGSGRSHSSILGLTPK